MTDEELALITERARTEPHLSTTDALRLVAEIDQLRERLRDMKELAAGRGVAMMEAQAECERLTAECLRMHEKVAGQSAKMARLVVVRSCGECGWRTMPTADSDGVRYCGHPRVDEGLVAPLLDAPPGGCPLRGAT